MNQQVIEHQGKVLSIYINEARIKATVSELAQQLSQDYAGKNVLILGILNGAFMFLSDLVREFSFTDFDIDFVKLKSYEGTKSTDIVEELIGMKGEIKGRHVLIVDDILETGQTLSKMLSIVSELGALDVKICVLIHKLNKLKVDVKVQYVGIEIEDVFIIGYGMDWKERFRGLRDIYIAKQK